MKILFIAYNDMSKRNGGSICTKSYIDVFRDIADEFILMCPYSCKYAWDFSGIDKIEVPRRTLFYKMVNLLNGCPHRFYPYIKSYWDRINDVDFVVLSGSILGYGIAEWLKKEGVPFICIHHNFELDYHKGNKTQTSLYGLNLHRIKKIEKFVLKNSFVNITLTESDKYKLIEYYKLDNSIKLINIGCFVSKNEYRPFIDPQQNKEKIVITGALCDYQTEDGIIDYIENYHSIVLKYLPNVVVSILGRNPSDKIVEMCSRTKNINLYPSPHSIEDFIKDAFIYINPTKIGSGLKLRNMDALKLGIPVLAHRKSCAGYESINGKAVFEYDSPNSFEIRLKEMIKESWDKDDIQNLFYSSFSYNNALDNISQVLKSI